MTKEELSYANDCITQAAKLLADRLVWESAELLEARGLYVDIHLRLDDWQDRIATFISDNNPPSKPIDTKSEEHYL